MTPEDKEFCDELRRPYWSDGSSHAMHLKSAAAIERLSANEQVCRAEWNRANDGWDKAKAELAALRAQIAEAQPAKFLVGGTRYKVAQLNDSCGIFCLPSELAGAWVALVDATDDCHLHPAADAKDAALENCRLLAARNRKEEWAQHILRFCESAGTTGSPLRDAAMQERK